MANVIVPEQHRADFRGVTKVDPKRPESDPNYKRALMAGKRNAKKMTFADRGEEERYNKAVASNRNNIYGLPAFYPPEYIQPSHGFGEGKETGVLPCGHKWCRLTENGVYSCKQRHQYFKTNTESTQWSALS